jgi:hypothetical protein
MRGPIKGRHLRLFIYRILLLSKVHQTVQNLSGCTAIFRSFGPTTISIPLNSPSCYLRHGAAASPNAHERMRVADFAIAIGLIGMHSTALPIRNDVHLIKVRIFLSFNMGQVYLPIRTLNSHLLTRRGRQSRTSRGT